MYIRVVQLLLTSRLYKNLATCRVLTTKKIKKTTDLKNSKLKTKNGEEK